MRLAVRCFAACVLLSAAYAADNLPSAVFDSQRCRSGSCKGAGSRRYHVLDYMKHVFLSIGLVKFFRILPQKFFFVFVLIHKFCSWFLEIFGQMQPGHAGCASAHDDVRRSGEAAMRCSLRNTGRTAYCNACQPQPSTPQRDAIRCADRRDGAAMQRRPHIYDTGPPGPAGYRSALPDYRSTVTSASCAPVISCSAFTLSSI